MQTAECGCNELQSARGVPKGVPTQALHEMTKHTVQQVYFFVQLMVARAGVQPATFALGVRCSMQLSYRATCG